MSDVPRDDEQRSDELRAAVAAGVITAEDQYRA